MKLRAGGGIPKKTLGITGLHEISGREHLIVDQLRAIAVKWLFLNGKGCSYEDTYTSYICTFQGFLMGESEQPIICSNIARQSFDLGRLSTEAAKILHGNTQRLLG